MKFQDYYQTLGVDKSASAAQIQKAYRKQARKYHPDVNKEANAEDSFKKVTEAYEVLKDSEKRARYDQLGANFHAGQDFRPPPGFNGGQFARSSAEANFSSSGFSDFFETLFGGGQFFSDAAETSFSGQRARRHAPEAILNLTISEAIAGAAKMLSIQLSPQGPIAGASTKTLNVKIPPLTANGSKIRIGGKAGSADEILLHVAIVGETDLAMNGDDIIKTLRISPWEATLGAAVSVTLPDGEIRLTIPAGSQTGQKLRIRNHGLAKKQKGQRGDAFCELKIVVPQVLTERERELLEKLKEISNFDPRR